MNILAGEIQPDEGELIFNGDAITILLLMQQGNLA